MRPNTKHRVQSILLFRAVARDLSVARTPSRREINGLATLQGCHLTPCYKGGFVLQFALSITAAIRVFFRSRGDTALEVLALRQQVAALKQKRPRPPLNLSTASSGALCAVSGLVGRTSWRSSNPRPSSAGIGQGSACTGGGVRARAAVGRRAPPRFEVSSAGWRKRTQLGEHPRSTVRF